MKQPFSKKYLTYDIAVLWIRSEKYNQKVRFSDRVKPVCLPQLSQSMDEFYEGFEAICFFQSEFRSKNFQEKTFALPTCFSQHKKLKNMQMALEFLKNFEIFRSEFQLVNQMALP